MHLCNLYMEWLLEEAGASVKECSEVIPDVYTGTFSDTTIEKLRHRQGRCRNVGKREKELFQILHA